MENNKILKVLGSIMAFLLITQFSMPGIMKTEVGLVISGISVIIGILLVVFGIRELLIRRNNKN